MPKALGVLRGGTLVGMQIFGPISGVHSDAAWLCGHRLLMFYGINIDIPSLSNGAVIDEKVKPFEDYCTF